jgi:hypothetical protein
MELKPKITTGENELMGVTHGLVPAGRQPAQKEDALMPSLEEKQIEANAAAIEAVKHLIAFAQIKTNADISFSEAERKAMLGAGADSDWKAYGEHFLAVDVAKPADTRMHYLLPVVKDGRVHLKALVRACGSDVKAVAQAAWDLCKAANMVPAEQGAMKPMKADMACPVMAAGRGCPMNAAGRCAHLNDSAECRMQMPGMACALTTAGKPACPLMAGGEGCPTDSWSGCAQLSADGECGLQDGSPCCMAKAGEADED